MTLTGSNKGVDKFNFLTVNQRRLLMMLMRAPGHNLPLSTLEKVFAKSSSSLTEDLATLLRYRVIQYRRSFSNEKLVQMTDVDLESLHSQVKI